MAIDWIGFADMERKRRQEEGPFLLMDVAKRCAEVYDGCAKEDADLFGCSLLDLCADNITDVSLSDLKAAIVVSGIYSRANERIRRQIASYK